MIRLAFVDKKKKKKGLAFTETVWLCDLFQGLPRFQQQSLDHNRTLHEKVNAMAEKKN